MTPSYHVLRREDIAPAPAAVGQSSGFLRAPLVGAENDAVHTGLGLCSLGNGRVDTHVHSYEEGFYVLTGRPVLYLDGLAVRLAPGACGGVPVGAPHAWRHDGEEPATWIEMCSPCPRSASRPPDTFYLGDAPDSEPAELDVRDPRTRHLFLLGDDDMDLDLLKQGSKKSAPTVSASMTTAALAYSGITVKMLVDARLDLQLLTMFMVAYQPGAVAHPHDHPFEEAYYMLEGEVEAVAEDERFTLRPGDVFWTGAGCIHAFYETRGERVRWLETSAPQPPNRHAYRFERDWEYLAERLRDRPS
ncbi:MAG TPA: cupin domain-containing protein [Gaiellaceae bacterium]|nr:cupin domain-containing protein [Gaiellaceae bacterium]